LIKPFWLLILLLLSLLAPVPATEPIPTWWAPMMMDCINQDRTATGLEPLEYSPILSVIAYRHSAEMGSSQVLSHNGFTERVSLAQKLGYTVTGENCGVWARMWFGVKQIHQAFMSSPGHRANLMNPGARKIGIGVWMDKQEIWVTELIAK